MRTIPLVLALASIAEIVSAQATPAQPSPMTPRPAHERLAVFEGTWKKADSPANDRFREICAWLEGGRRHMICRPPAGNKRVFDLQADRPDNTQRQPMQEYADTHW